MQWQTNMTLSKRLLSTSSKRLQSPMPLVLHANLSHALLLHLVISLPPAPPIVLQGPRQPLKAIGVPQLRQIALLHPSHRLVPQITSLTSRIPFLMVFPRRSQIEGSENMFLLQERECGSKS